MKAFMLGILFSLTFFFTGCGGGSAGVSVGIDTTPTAEQPTINFQSWSSIVPPTEVTIGAMTQETAYSTNDEPSPVFLYDDKGIATTTTVTIEYDLAGDVQALNILTPETNLVWNIFSGDLINDSYKRATLFLSDGTFVGAFVQPQHFAVGWEYQTFGVWETGRGDGTGSMGGVSMGAPTVDSAIPTTGEVDFTGETMGLYVTADGSDFLTYSDLSVSVDFANLGAMELSSTGTYKIPVDSLPGISIGTLDETLNFAGTLAYDAGANTFSGEVSGFGMVGTSTGQFYGPGAEELGGVFSLSAGDGAYYSGAYGAER